MNRSYFASLRIAVWLLVCLVLSSARGHSQEKGELLVSIAEPGRMGGRLVLSLRSEPRTFNPVSAIDQTSIGVMSRMMADLIHINRQTQKVEPGLAKSWTVSRDGTQFTLKLRRGLRFSDGVPVDADDVLFSFRVYLDEQVHSPHRDLLVISDKPIKVEKLDTYTVRFTFSAPYAPAERLFDTLPVLPRHLLEKDYLAGGINQAWGLNTPPEKIAGLGPFRLKQVVPGERIILERNPYYWKVDAKGLKLPYLDELTFLIVQNQDAQVVRFQAGDAQIVSGLSADNFAALEAEQQAGHYKLYDAGPSLEYNFLMFNLNHDTAGRLPEVERKQKWFRDVRFRQAMSAAIDREAIVRLVYRNRGVPLAAYVSPGYKLWFDSSIPVPVRSLVKSRELLKSAGFSWKQDGTLLDAAGQPVEFTILVGSSNAQRGQMATLVQDDLKHLGIQAHVVLLETRAVADRVLNSHDYEAVVMGIASGDADPNADKNIVLSTGQTHVWHLGQKKPATPWEAEVDLLMERQAVTLNYQQRRKIFDRVQEILAQQLPIICLASPHVLVGARENLGNFRPASMEQYTFWNAEEFFWRTPAGKN